jgi:hypothetical protein
MKKVRLDPEALAVESFTTLGVPRTRGTVWGAGSQVPAPTARPGGGCYPSVDCESGMCVGTGATGCCTAMDCQLEPWTNGQDTCQTCPSCATCPGILTC